LAQVAIWPSGIPVIMLGSFDPGLVHWTLMLGQGMLVRGPGVGDGRHK